MKISYSKLYFLLSFLLFSVFLTEKVFAHWKTTCLPIPEKYLPIRKIEFVFVGSDFAIAHIEKKEGTKKGHFLKFDLKNPEADPLVCPDPVKVRNVWPVKKAFKEDGTGHIYVSNYDVCIHVYKVTKDFKLEYCTSNIGCLAKNATYATKCTPQHLIRVIFYQAGKGQTKYITFSNGNMNENNFNIDQSLTPYLYQDGTLAVPDLENSCLYFYSPDQTVIQYKILN